jgi:hypothetical protein
MTPIILLRCISRTHFRCCAYPRPAPCRMHAIISPCFTCIAVWNLHLGYPGSHIEFYLLSLPKRQVDTTQGQRLVSISAPSQIGMWHDSSCYHASPEIEYRISVSLRSIVLAARHRKASQKSRKHVRVIRKVSSTTRRQHGYTVTRLYRQYPTLLGFLVYT